MAAADISKSALHIAEQIALGEQAGADEAQDTFEAAVDTVSEANATTLGARLDDLEATVDTDTTGLSDVVADHDAAINTAVTGILARLDALEAEVFP